MEVPLPRRMDSYKNKHSRMGRPGTTHKQYHFIARGGPFEKAPFFGLQYYLKEYLSKPVTEADVDYAWERARRHFGDDSHFNYEGWMHIVREHDGYLPLLIRAVPEGTVVNVPNAFFTVENTCPKCAWVPGAFETLLEKVWYPITVGATSMWMREQFVRARRMAGADGEGLAFQLHDFGYRGVSSEESAAIGGAAHLLFFMGTDTQIATDFLEKYYRDPMAGYSVAASEHSVACEWGPDDEEGYLDNLLVECPTGILSVVADTYDIYGFIENVVKPRKDAILARDGKFVLRPDSGAVETELPRIFEVLWDIFGGTTNAHGFRSLDPKVGIIWGDGISRDSMPGILESLLAAKIVPENPFGMGGALLQKVNRDTMKVAYKGNWALIDGESVPIFKSTVTDPSKASWQYGRIALAREEGRLLMVPESGENEMVPIFENGKVLREYTLDEVRKRAAL